MRRNQGESATAFANRCVGVCVCVYLSSGLREGSNLMVSCLCISYLVSSLCVYVCVCVCVCVCVKGRIGD